MKRFCFLILLISLQGCRVGPNYHRPPMQVCDEWVAESIGTPVENSLNAPWWMELNDPLLNSFVELTLNQNYSLQGAYSRICQAVELRKQASSYFYPGVDGSINYERGKGSFGALMGGVSPGNLAGLSSLENVNFESTFDAIWEIDLFGRTYRQVQGARAFIGSEIQMYRLMQVTLVSETVRAYAEARLQQAILALQNKALVLAEDQLMIAKERLLSGLDPEQSVLESGKFLRDLKSAITLTSQAFYQAVFRLSVLTGNTPACLVCPIQTSEDLMVVSDAINAGVPSELLRRRPDIIQAEWQIAKATADVGVAVADFFPRVTLTGSYGYSYSALGPLNNSQESWSYGLFYLTPIFHAGKFYAALQQKKCALKEMLSGYYQTTLTALQEAEDGLISFARMSEREKSEFSRFELENQTLTLIQEQFDRGLIDQTSLIQQEITALQSRQLYLQSRFDKTLSFIALHKALASPVCP